MAIPSHALPHTPELLTTQEIQLSAGWNLISIQVDRFNDSATGFPFAAIVSDPTNDTDNAIELDVSTDALTDVWTFDNDTKQWRGWRNPAAVPALPLPNAGQALTALHPGRGYWVRVADTCTLRVEGIPWDGDHSLTTGWNLVGFPGMTDPTQPNFTLEQALGNQFDAIKQVWTFEAGSTQAFTGYDPSARPGLFDLNEIQPGSAYWLHVETTVNLQPDAFPQLPPDADVPDSDNALSTDGTAGIEDQDYDGNGILEAATASQDNDDLDGNGIFDDGTDLNGNGILDDSRSQDFIRFDFGDDTETVIISNPAASLANWHLEIDPSISWLRADRTNGTVGTAANFITLTADRTGLNAGVHRVDDLVTLHVGTTSKTIDVVLRIAPVAGDWKGYATTTRVNGKNISLGAVDLALSFFMDNSDNLDETFFRAVINRDRSLLFPEDVFMTGVFYSDTAFTMTTNFPMPAAERNMPPFDTFADGATPVGRPNAEFPDSDPNNDGKLSHSSPFPFEVFREVTLIGERVSNNRLEGTYVESIQDALPNGKNVFIEGNFFLVRESGEPTRRSIHNKTQVEDPAVIIGGTAAENPFASTISFDQSVRVDGVELEMALDFAAPTDLTITLKGPDGTTVLVHNRDTALPGTFSTDAFDGILADVNDGDWTLTVSWDETTGERGFFGGWQLRVGGFVFHNVSGLVVDDTNQPIANADVTLSGHNLITTLSTDGTGAFSFTELTSDNYSFSVSAPNYRTTTQAFRIRDADVIFDGQPDNEPRIKLIPVTVTTSTVSASPRFGITAAAVPFATTLTAFFTDAHLTAAGPTPLVEWDFSYESGNFQAEAGPNLLSFEQAFSTPGIYQIACRLAGNNAIIAGPTTVIVTAGSETTASYPDGQAIDFQLTRLSYVGAIAARSTAGQHGTIPDGNVLYQESQRDVAGFDLDRYPTAADPGGSFDPTKEDTEVTANDPDYTSAAGYQQYQPQALDQRFRMITTMGGYVFSPQPSQSGDIVLQAGRIEE